jgi:hypothetical protein
VCSNRNVTLLLGSTANPMVLLSDGNFPARNVQNNLDCASILAIIKNLNKCLCNTRIFREHGGYANKDHVLLVNS